MENIIYVCGKKLQVIGEIKYGLAYLINHKSMRWDTLSFRMTKDQSVCR